MSRTEISEKQLNELERYLQEAAQQEQAFLAQKQEEVPKVEEKKLVLPSGWEVEGNPNNVQQVQFNHYLPREKSKELFYGTQNSLITSESAQEDDFVFHRTDVDRNHGRIAVAFFRQAPEQPQLNFSAFTKEVWVVYASDPTEFALIPGEEWPILEGTVIRLSQDLAFTFQLDLNTDKTKWTLSLIPVQKTSK